MHQQDCDSQMVIRIGDYSSGNEHLFCRGTTHVIAITDDETPSKNKDVDRIHHCETKIDSGIGVAADMNSLKKSHIVIGALLLLVGAICVVLRRTPEPRTAAESGARIEPTTGAATRPLDHDFKAAMQRDSEAAAPASEVTR